VGREVVVDVGPVAHGGHCVSRHDGRVVFVRHALPGERVRAVVTEGAATSSFWRADAVEVLLASDDRVDPPCPWARPGQCGGCDLQHASLDAQRRLKADVVREQLRRLAGIERDVTVEAVPGDTDGLGWRTRVRFAVGEDGRAGLRARRSHRVVPIDRCRIAHHLVSAAGVLVGRWPAGSTVEVAASVGTGEVVVLSEGAVGRRAGDDTLTERVGQRSFRVSRGGFWQVHPGAATTLLDAVLVGLDPRPGESALDLYSGVGLFSASLAERVGETGRVTAVESDRGAVADARHNLADLPQVRVDAGRVDHVLRRPHLCRADLVVLDPPRSGAGKQVVRLLSRVAARRIAYVACDPAALARDLRWFAEEGYELESLKAYDLFPMTHHVECVAVVAPASPSRRS
jgi:tRNA/tmRNA/rRNA uracil-C5-methylase (TrmA/RlmC/RlmD family)